MAFSHRSAVLAWLLSCSCAPGPEPGRVVETRVHSLDGCPVSRVATLDLTALGDFDATALTSDSLDVMETGRRLGFPEETRAIEALALDGLERWRGVAEAEQDGRVDIALWRDTEPCEVYRAGDDGIGYPGPGGGQAIGFAPAQRSVLVTGGDSRVVDESTGALVLNLRTGRARAVDLDDLSNERRAHASISVAGDRLLVAGGFDPEAESGSPRGRALATAHFFDPEQRAFTQRIELADARSRHAAVTLPDGATLLLGGMSETGQPHRTLEVVTADGESRIAGLATLERGRISPAVAQLTDGRILVGGGADERGNPVDGLEWLAPDASRIVGATELPARLGLALVALPAGAALAVGGCDASATKACAGDAEPACRCVNPLSDCSCLDPCPIGCATREVRWIAPSGMVILLDELPVDPGAAPRLVPAEDGAPWLLAERGALRFDPWSGRFSEVEDVALRAPPARSPNPVAVEPGLFVWLDETEGISVMRGLRHGTRGRFSRDVAPLLLTGPEHVFPSTPPGIGGIGYEPTKGLILRGPGAVAAVTDTTFSTLSLEIEIASGPPPVVILGGSRIGGPDCPWPAAPTADAQETLTVQRVDTVAVLGRSGAFRRCPVKAGRVDVRLAGTEGPATIARSILVRRRPPEPP